MKITTARIITQFFFFALFMWLVVATSESFLLTELEGEEKTLSESETELALKEAPVSIFLEIDPLVALTTALSTHSLYRGLLWSLAVIIPTLLLGRVFCGWVCPYGAIHHFVGWLGRKRKRKQKISDNIYRKSQSLKYVILIVMLILAVFGSVQIGLLDPIAQLHRAFAIFTMPALDTVTPTGLLYTQTVAHQWAWVAGLMFLVFVAMNLYRPRWFCRVLCPLGALLGILSRFSLFRITRDLNTCTDCKNCVIYCEGACEPDAKLRKAECFVCFNCLEDCQPRSFSFPFLPERETEITDPDLSRRRLVFSGIAGLFAFPWLRGDGSLGRGFRPEVIRPPGSLKEPDFLATCLKCDQCVRVCPTNVIQPALFEAGLEGIWTPILNMKFGACSFDCILCGQVCPTGAIQRITVGQKTGRGEWEGKMIKVGTAFFDWGRCLPWAMATPCSVCQEVCPVSPKAIYMKEVEVEDRDGNKITLEQPYVDTKLCNGCGWCQHECPVEDLPAIRVTAIGETRDPERSLTIDA